MDGISAFCEDPNNPFQVRAELKVRKMLEKHTGWEFEFTRNDHQFGVDILAYKYKLVGNDFQKTEVGKIEVEASIQWKNGVYPAHWKTYSYLRRKVEEWDKLGSEDESIWQGAPKPDCSKRIYLKCAIDLSDCHSAVVSDIWDNAKQFLKTDRTVNRESRRWVYRIPLAKDRITKRGWKQSINFAINYFNHLSN